MISSRRKIEELLWVTRLHRPARTLYSKTIGRRPARLHDSMRSFYRNLLPSNSLVFDIGANVGGFAGIFSSLGTRVIAVEPNSDCVRHIQLSYPGVEVIQAVAGARNGLAVLNQSDERDDISSVSNEWIAALKEHHQEFDKLWSKRLNVPMLTLDTLVDHFGMPSFIKIDVEGFEEFVLNGLSKQPPLLSFEFNTDYLEAALRCLDKPVFADESLFNFALGDPVRFELKEWVKKDQLKHFLQAQKNSYGDVFVKSPLL